MIPLDQIKSVNDLVVKAKDLGEVWDILSPFIKLEETEINVKA